MPKKQLFSVRKHTPALFVIAVASILFLCWLPTALIHVIILIWKVQIPDWIVIVTVFFFAVSALSMLILAIVTVPIPEGFEWDSKPKDSNRMGRFFWHLAGWVILFLGAIAGIIAGAFDAIVGSRFAMSMVSLLGIIALGYWSIVLTDNTGSGHTIAGYLLISAFVMWSLSIVLFALRGILGIVRLLPKSWLKPRRTT